MHELTTLSRSFLTVAEIETQTQCALNSALETELPDVLYVRFKQLERAVEMALKILSPLAVEAVAIRAKGETKTTIGIHTAQLTAPKVTWVYSAELEKYKQMQADSLKSRQLQEKADGTATQIQSSDKFADLKITLKQN
jgi:hypothetical protein